MKELPRSWQSAFLRRIDGVDGFSKHAQQCCTGTDLNDALAFGARQNYLLCFDPLHRRGKLVPEGVIYRLVEDSLYWKNEATHTINSISSVRASFRSVSP